MKRILGFFLIGVMSAGGCVSKKEESAAEAVQEPAPARSGDFERAVPPAMLTEPHERADYLITHFWDKFDFTDTMYCHTPDITEQAFVDFIGFFPHASSYRKISEGIKKMMTAAEVENVMYQYFCSTAERYLYDPNSPMRNDEYYTPFVEHIVNSSKVTDIRKVRFRYLLALLYRNRPGAKAEDFVYTTLSGKTGNLHSLSAKYLLLMFYNPDCEECRHTTEILKNSPVVADAVSSGRLKALALYPDENIEALKKHRNDIPSSWINAYDRSLAIKNNEIYDLKAIPTLYLLDKDKKVILKDTSTADIHEYLERNR